MTSIEFCYWAQGLFELAEPKKLTPSQVECILRHIDLVDKSEDGKQKSSFPAWLRGALESCESRTIRGSRLEAIRKKLNDCFQHEVDPLIEASGKDLKKLVEVHRPKNTGWGGSPLIQC